MARPMPRAPPVTTAVFRSSRIADRFSLVIETMDAALFRCQPDPAARSLDVFAGRAHGKPAASRRIAMQEGVGAEMLGESDRALPFTRRVRQGDMLRADPDRVRLVICRDLARHEIHFG